MALGIKLLIGGVALATASCGGYMVYKKVSEFDAEKAKDAGSSDATNTETQNLQKNQEPSTQDNSPKKGASDTSGSVSS